MVSEATSPLRRRLIETKVCGVCVLLLAFTAAGVSQNVAELYRELFEGFTKGATGWERHGTRFVRGAIDPKDVVQQLFDRSVTH